MYSVLYLGVRSALGIANENEFNIIVQTLRNPRKNDWGEADKTEKERSLYEILSVRHKN